MAAEFYILPITDDADRTFSCLLGDTLYNFRMYYVQGGNNASFWHLDVYDADMQPLALGRRLINGSINIYKGYANELAKRCLAVGLRQGAIDNEDIEQVDCDYLWITDAEDSPFADEDPMEHLYESFKLVTP